MSADVVEIDMDLVEELTKREDSGARSRSTRAASPTARRRSARLPGGVSLVVAVAGRRTRSTSAAARASHVWDIDENEYVDYHNGYGVMVMGHAHPKIVEAVRERVALGTHFAQPTEDALIVADQLAERFELPFWRFGNSGTESTLDAVRIMRATHRPELILKIEGTYHGHHDSLMVSVFPPKSEAGPREHPARCPQTLGMPEAVRRPGRSPCRSTISRRRERAFEEHPRRDRRHDRRAGHDELRPGAARPRLPRRR